jgi:hypothetical protein
MPRATTWPPFPSGLARPDLDGFISECRLWLSALSARSSRGCRRRPVGIRRVLAHYLWTLYDFGKEMASSPDKPPYG